MIKFQKMVVYTFIEITLEYYLTVEQILIFWDLKREEQKELDLIISLTEGCMAIFRITRNGNSKLIDKSSREGLNK
jgi:hypothetical protein